MSSNASNVGCKVILNQTRYSGAKYVIRFPIWVRFLKMLTEVNSGQISTAKMLNSLNSHGRPQKLDRPYFQPNLTIPKLLKLLEFYSEAIFLEFWPELTV